MCSLAIWHRSQPSGTSDDRNWRTNEPKLIQMCSLAIWHKSRPSGISDDQNWRTNEPKLVQMCSLAIWHTSRPSGTSDDRMAHKRAKTHSNVQFGHLAHSDDRNWRTNEPK